MSTKARALLIVVAAACAIQARDLKAELTAMAPAGKTIRLAYVKGGPPQNFNAATGAAIFALSSEDGVIRKIYPAGTAVADVHCVSMTDDGTRVVFYDYGKGQVVVVNYNGTLVRTFSAPLMYDYWLNPSDKTEWVIVSDDATVSRINLNAPTAAAVTVVTQANLNKINALVHDGGCGGISDDGLKIVLTQENPSNSTVVLMTASTGAFVPGEPGCWGQIRTGTPVQFSQNPGGKQHQGPQIYNADGSKAQYLTTSATLDAWFTQNPSMDLSNLDCYPEVGHASDGHRWLRDNSYLTFTCQRSLVNPILWRVSDSKWMYIEDNLNCIFAGDMDGVVGTFPSVGTLQQPGSRPGRLQQQAADSRTYSLNGRLLAQPARADRSQKGILIRQSANGTVTRVCR